MQLWGFVPGGSSSFPWRQQARVVRTEQKDPAVKCMYMCGIKSLNFHETWRRDKTGILHLLLGSRDHQAGTVTVCARRRHWKRCAFMKNLLFFKNPLRTIKCKDKSYPVKLNHKRTGRRGECIQGSITTFALFSYSSWAPGWSHKSLFLFCRWGNVAS